MADCMEFPNTAEGFIEQYKFTDTKQEYTNGSELIPVFRVKQMMEHYFATDNHVGGKWIPVTERLPELIPCDAGTAYSEAVNVLTSGRKVLTAIWDGTDFIADAEFWEAEGEEITHWTPVLLPLPEPPKRRMIMEENLMNTNHGETT